MSTENKRNSIRQAGGKSSVGAQLRRYRTECGLSQLALAEKIGVSRNTITNWETGYRRPDLESIRILSEILGVSASELLGAADAFELTREEKSALLEYRRLNPANRYIIRRTMAAMTETQDSAAASAQENRRPVKALFKNDARSAAGYSAPLDAETSGETVYLYLDDQVARADEIITVSGDSMEPTYHDGDELLVEYTPNLAFGEIGIFIVNDEGYVKEYGRDGLRSHNPDYPVMRFADGDSVRCVGRVLGVVDKSQYASDEDAALDGESQ